MEWSLPLTWKRSSTCALIEKQVLTFKHMVNKLIKKSSKWSFWVAVMASQTGIWSVIWLKCTEKADGHLLFLTLGLFSGEYGIIESVLLV